VRRLSQQDLGLYKQAFFVVTTAMNLLPLGFAMSGLHRLHRPRHEVDGVALAHPRGDGAVQGVVVLRVVLLEGQERDSRPRAASASSAAASSRKRGSGIAKRPKASGLPRR
jgi:hypothetical protein